jgi:hypothetical protein
MSPRIPKEEIDKIAQKHKYVCFDYQENIGMASYSDGATRINVYLTKMTVATCLNHPNQGPTQLFRKNVSLDMLDEIFEYPRTHTGKGYKQKSKK